MRKAISPHERLRTLTELRYISICTNKWSRKYYKCTTILRPHHEDKGELSEVERQDGRRVHTFLLVVSILRKWCSRAQSSDLSSNLIPFMRDVRFAVHTLRLTWYDLSDSTRRTINRCVWIGS
jgi:hypothetical protein